MFYKCPVLYLYFNHGSTTIEVCIFCKNTHSWNSEVCRTRGFRLQYIFVMELVCWDSEVCRTRGVGGSCAGLAQETQVSASTRGRLASTLVFGSAPASTSFLQKQDRLKMEHIKNGKPT
uniref:Uncharacterized protein n=1 Tax=Aegilops tauschii subsp. strangulata TaxID=200361 RepID=A0A453LKZ1_AEGTS